MAKRKKPYKVGYGQPPRGTQFRPGQSGNPRGRPKGSRNFVSVMKKVLLKPVDVRHNGIHKKMPTQEAFANLLATRALAGDAKAMGLLIRLVDQVDNDPAETSAREPAMRPEDELVMESIVRRIRSMEELLPRDGADSAEPSTTPTEK